MKPSEASKIFNKWMNCKDAYQADPQCDGKCLSCEYYTASDEDEKEAMQMAISALERQETAKIVVGKSRGGVTLWHECSKCGEAVDAKDTFCRKCGRKLIYETE